MTTMQITGTVADVSDDPAVLGQVHVWETDATPPFDVAVFVSPHACGETEKLSLLAKWTAEMVERWCESGPDVDGWVPSAWRERGWYLNCRRVEVDPAILGMGI